MSTTCGNCEASLTGPYCAACGQHAHASARNLSALMHDGWHDLTHLDGRLWRTLWYLMTQPGHLTVDYFAERRARYLPPVRLYLVVSLLFFSFSLTNDVHLEAPHTAADVRHFPCADIRVGGVAVFEREARQACEKAQLDGGAEFLAGVAHRVPKMMFVFLPLMAAVMSLLYWRPRRYYVEHLVYLLHNHSALFLAFSLWYLLGRLAGTSPALRWLDTGSSIAGTLYAAVYPFLSMRRYYRQGRALTFVKYAAIAFAYLVCLLITLFGTALLTALSS